MVRVTRRPGEDDERLLRRFKREVEKSGIISELKRRAYYDKNYKRNERYRRQRAASNDNQGTSTKQQ